MAIELVSCPACGRKNASDRTNCLSCGADLPISNAREHQLISSWGATLWERIKTVRLNSWQRLWVLLSALWFLGWLVGFPLYVRSKDLRDAEFFVQRLLDLPRFGTEPTPTLGTEEIERARKLYHRMESLLKDNPQLAQKLEEEEQRFARERTELQMQLVAMSPWPKEPTSDFLKRVNDGLNEQWRQQFENSLYKQVLLTAAKEDVSLGNVYKRLLKSNWLGWGLYVLIAPLAAYAAVCGFIAAVRWVRQGFHNSAGT